MESDSQPGEEFFLRPRCPDRLTVAPVWLVAVFTQPDFEAHRPLASICMPEYGYVHGTLVVEWATMVEFTVAPCSDRFWDFSNSPFFRYLGGAHQIRMARLNIYLFSMSRIGMRAPLQRLTLFALGTGKFSKCMRESVCISASINFARYGKWAGS